MCDTWVALQDATEDHRVLLGKNSDRPIFDCQPLVRNPGQTWPGQARVHLAYLTLPQVPETYTTLGSRPYWCWGYEEGINEHGLVIGNEAIFTKPVRRAVHAYRQGQQPELGLLGMELVRLGLERCRTAAQAVQLIGELTATYGQFGSAVPQKDHAAGSYDNSFLIADGNEAWVLESAGKRWAARCFHQGTTSISNQITIRTRWDAGSQDLTEYAVGQQWWPAAQSSVCDFARAYSDEAVSRQVSHIRLMRSRQLLTEQAGAIDTRWMQRIARDHYEDTFLGGPYFDAADPDFLSICMHASPAEFTWGNTASSCIAVLPRAETELPIFWWTPGPPCTGCYVPFFVHGQSLPEIVTRAGTAGNAFTSPPATPVDSFQPESYWWLFRHLLDSAKGDAVYSLPGFFAQRASLIRQRFDALEEQMALDLPAVVQDAMLKWKDDRSAGAQILDQFSLRCVERVTAALQEVQALFDQELVAPTDASLAPVS